jgi:hypothetical protein
MADLRYLFVLDRIATALEQLVELQGKAIEQIVEDHQHEHADDIEPEPGSQAALDALVLH